MTQDKEVEAKPEYDMSIHSNPDAKAWAEFFNECLVKRGEQPLDPDLMLAWFANAMMAMHDHIYQVKVPELKKENSALRERVKELEKHLESAAKTAHARADDFCYGSFESCPNCKDWRKALSQRAGGEGKVNEHTD